MTGPNNDTVGGINQLNVDGDLLSGETPAWTVVDSDGDARLYAETDESREIKPGDAFVEATKKDGRIIEVGMIEERELDKDTEIGIPLVDVETGEEVEFAFEEDLENYAGVVKVTLVS